MDATRESLRSRIALFKQALPKCWSSETSSLWTVDNPARGQCSVTALVAHRLFGGELLKTSVGQQNHFYNRVDGCVVDFTASQFAAVPMYLDLLATRDEVLADTNERQVEALLGAVTRAMPAIAAETGVATDGHLGR